ncbi:MAG TPA: AEC family transporter, partial [Hydrogenophaga sp.]|nr:AEC family transporter [Hydrogenophaga sp.]
MDLIARIADVIIPVFLIVAIGYGYARRSAPDLTVFNRVALDVLAPMLVYSALAAKDFHITEHITLLVGGAILILGGGLIAWPMARALGAQPRTLVPVVMFNNCGNMGLPLALLAFGPAHFGAAVALFSVSNLL